MRWPWQRKEAAPEPAEPAGAPPAAPRGAAGPAPSPAGWAFLPPLQRTLGEPGTTTAPHRFTDRLPTRTDPSFTGTMSHLISADAPAGVIDLDGPDAGPAAEPPGSAGRSVELTLLPPPAPSGTGAGRPVQRLTPAVQRSLTSVPEGDFGVLRLPVLPEPGDGVPEPSTEHPAQHPEERPAEPPTAQGGTGAALDARGPFDVSGSVHDGVPSSALTPGGADGPGRAVPPLQRSVPDRSDSGSAGGSGRDSGGTFDGTATIVPLPRRATPLQRTADTASTGAAPSPIRPSGPAAPPRLGLGRPWPAHDPDPAGTEQPPVQRTSGSPGPPPAVPAAPPATATSSPPGPPAGRTAAPQGPSVPADPADPHAAVADDGPARSSSWSSPAEVRTDPVVSRSPADERPVDEPPARPPAENPGGGGPVSGGSPPASLFRERTGGRPAPFADPPLFAGRQTPDARRPDVLPVVSRAADGASTGGGRSAAPGGGADPAVPGAPHRPSAGPGDGLVPSAPVLPASQPSAGRSPGEDGPDAGPEGLPLELPVVSRSATSSPAEEPDPGAATAAGEPASPQTAPRPGPAGPDVQRAVPGARGAAVPGSGAAVPETAPFSSGARSPSAAGHPARSVGLRPSLSLPVVSRSAGEAPGSARSSGQAAHTTAPPAAPATSPPVPGPPAAPVAGTTVSRSAADLRPGPAGPAESVSLSGRAPGGGEQAGEPAFLPAVAVPGGRNGSPPGPARVLQAPISTLQRSSAGPGNLQRRPRLRGAPLGPEPAAAVVARADAPAPAPGTPHGDADRVAGAGGEPVAMLLALPGREPPGTAPSRPAAGSPVQRQEAPDGTVPPPAAASSSSGGPGSVQRVGEEPGAGPAAAEPAATPASPAAAGEAGEAGEAGMSQDEVEALAKRLVVPIVRRIKADMLLDRERRGLRIDVG